MSGAFKTALYCSAHIETHPVDQVNQPSTWVLIGIEEWRDGISLTNSEGVLPVILFPGFGSILVMELRLWI